MKLSTYLKLCLMAALIGYLLRNSIDESTKQGKYKDPNEPTHFDKQLNLQKHLHNKSNKNENEENH